MEHAGACESCALLNSSVIRVIVEHARLAIPISRDRIEVWIQRKLGTLNSSHWNDERPAWLFISVGESQEYRCFGPATIVSHAILDEYDSIGLHLAEPLSSQGWKLLTHGDDYIVQINDKPAAFASAVDIVQAIASDLLGDVPVVAISIMGSGGDQLWLCVNGRIGALYFTPAGKHDAFGLSSPKNREQSESITLIEPGVGTIDVAKRHVLPSNSIARAFLELVSNHLCPLAHHDFVR
ncbi:unnamed protein product [Tuwongella immobilis]|uniref:Uncharacterized protein n=2 Tax=Tuwongella immobilis TaxID=692036 RepID=A0A6C2YIV5_9BACT|nr:unnamed protein product [Tuwongella immobilis]VTR98014.1 unnamed protein product [Tuwongella immobilis]